MELTKSKSVEYLQNAQKLLQAILNENAVQYSKRDEIVKALIKIKAVEVRLKNQIKDRRAQKINLKFRVPKLEAKTK